MTGIEGQAMEAPQAGGPNVRLARAPAVLTVVVVVTVIGLLIALEFIPNMDPPSTDGSQNGARQASAWAALTPSNTPPPPPDSSQEWVTLTADTPAGALAAFERSQMYASIKQSEAGGVGDSQYDLSHPETPALVRELRVTGAPVSPDVWVIPYDSASGSLVYVAILSLNADDNAVQPEYIEQLGKPRAHGRLAQYTQAQAVNMVQAQTHVALKAGDRPYLIYAPIADSAIAIGKWTGGGGLDTPLWLVSGADGQDRILTNDGKVYLPSQLPLAKAS